MQVIIFGKTRKINNWKFFNFHFFVGKLVILIYIILPISYIYIILWHKRKILKKTAVCTLQHLFTLKYIYTQWYGQYTSLFRWSSDAVCSEHTHILCNSTEKKWPSTIITHLNTISRLNLCQLSVVIKKFSYLSYFHLLHPFFFLLFQKL